MRFLWGHQVILIGSQDAVDEFAFVGFPGHDGGFAGFGGFEGVIAEVESEAAFDFLGVGAVAREAIIGEEWADIAIELDGGFLGWGLGEGLGVGECERESQQKRQGGETEEVHVMA